MTITIIKTDGSETQHYMDATKNHGVFNAVVKAREYACSRDVVKVLINGRRIWV